MDFNHILNWKLKQGSHPFPGPSGGTCINEAAIVAAGFNYRPVSSVEHMPQCFSRPICKLAMNLNDSANDSDRQKLLRFVTRLACADAPEIEKKRAAYIEKHLQTCHSFDERLQVLEGALMLGRQADTLAPARVLARMQNAQEARAAGRTLYDLFTRKKQQQPA